MLIMMRIVMMLIITVEIITSNISVFAIVLWNTEDSGTITPKTTTLGFPETFANYIQKSVCSKFSKKGLLRNFFIIKVHLRANAYHPCIMRTWLQSIFGKLQWIYYKVFQRGAFFLQMVVVFCQYKKEKFLFGWELL